MAGMLDKESRVAIKARGAVGVAHDPASGNLSVVDDCGAEALRLRRTWVSGEPD